MLRGWSPGGWLARLSSAALAANLPQTVPRNLPRMHEQCGEGRQNTPEPQQISREWRAGKSLRIRINCKVAR